MKKIIVAVFILFGSCTKDEPENKYDWEISTMDGYIYKVEYGKTEAEIQQLYHEPCTYFRTDEPKFCWYFSSDNTWRKNLSEKYISCFYKNHHPQKVDCSTSPNSEFWHTRTMHIHKATDQFSVSVTTARWYSNQDTLDLFNDKSIEIIISNTDDSLILLQRSDNGFEYY